MTTDLWMLVATAALHWGIIMLVAGPQILKNGMPWATGNRDEIPKPAAWVARADRTSKNLLENLPLAIILVLVAHVSGQADALTATGAVVFFVARVAHAIIYIAGIPWLRTLAWAVSVGGLGAIAFAIVT